MRDIVVWMGVPPLCKIEEEVWAGKGEPKELKHLEQPFQPHTKGKKENRETYTSSQGFTGREDISFFQQVKVKNAAG